MIEELKLITEIFKNTTDAALYAYLAYLGYGLAKLGLVVIPSYKAITFTVGRIFVSENSNEVSKDK